MLFLGCSLTDPDLLAFLDELMFQCNGHLGGAHFVLMRTKGMNALKRRNFEERYGIRILGDDAQDGFPDIPAFLHQLRTESPTSRPAEAPPPAPVSDSDAQDIVGLLEAMGQRTLWIKGPPAAAIISSASTKPVHRSAVSSRATRPRAFPLSNSSACTRRSEPTT